MTRVVLWDWLPWLQRREEERRQRNDAAVKIQVRVFYLGYLNPDVLWCRPCVVEFSFENT